MAQPIEVPPRIVGGVFMLIVVAVLAFSSCDVVPPGHRGVRVTMGTISQTELDEGLRFKWPLISTIYEQSIQQQAEERDTDCFSKDLQTVKVKYSILFRVPANQVVPLYRDYKGDPFTSLINNRAQEVLKQVTARYNSEELVQSRERVREETLKALKDRVGAIVEIVDMNIENIDLSDQLEKAIEQKMVSQQESLAKKFELEKETQQAAITLVQAKAEAESVKVKGEAIANSPRVIDLEIVKKWDGKTPTTVVIGNAGTGAQILLPISPGANQEK